MVKLELDPLYMLCPIYLNENPELEMLIHLDKYSHPVSREKNQAARKYLINLTL